MKSFSVFSEWNIKKTDAVQDLLWMNVFSHHQHMDGQDVWFCCWTMKTGLSACLSTWFSQPKSAVSTGILFNCFFNQFRIWRNAHHPLTELKETSCFLTVQITDSVCSDMKQRRFRSLSCWMFCIMPENGPKQITESLNDFQLACFSRNWGAAGRIWFRTSHYPDLSSATPYCPEHSLRGT